MAADLSAYNERVKKKLDKIFDDRSSSNLLPTLQEIVANYGRHCQRNLILAGPD
jgi:hypothetical protein